MKVKDEWKKPVDGITLEEYLKQHLKMHASNSKSAATLLTKILADDSYEVVIKTGAPTATKDKRVTINPTETKIDKAKTKDDLKEFVESAIFELTNARNSETFADLEQSLLSGNLPLMQYGLGKAKIEAEASWNVYRSIVEYKDYVPSAFGTGHVNACKAYGDNLAKYLAFFCDAPHDAKAKDKTADKLPSAQMYAYKGALTLAGTKSGAVLDTCFTITQKEKKKKISIKKWISKGVPANQQAMISTQNNFAQRFYHVLVDILATSDLLTVQYRAGAAKDWQFTPKMKEIQEDKDDVLKNSLVRALTANINDIGA